MLKINYINFVWKFVFIFMFVINNDIAPSESKYAVDYQKAFDQEQLYKSFVHVMKEWKCSENVLPNAVESSTSEDFSPLLEALKLDNPFLNVSCFNNVFYSIKKLILGLNNQELQWLGDTTLYNKLRIEFEALEKEILVFEKVREVILIHMNTTLEGSSNQLITQLREELNKSGLDLVKKLKDLIKKLDPEERFIANCIKQVDKAYEKARREPLIEDLATFAAATAAVAISVLRRDNYISAYALAQDSKDVIKTSLKYFSEPVTHSLGELERRYAINQCRIPRILWQTIINHFMLAQENKFETQNCMRFIDFSIGIKTFPSQRIGREINKDNVIEELNKRINKFFEAYTWENDYHLSSLQATIEAFIEKLFDDNAPQPHYLYLTSQVGGIGKTFFVSELCKWLNELLGNTIFIDNKLVINKYEDVVGDKKRAGALLWILRNQLNQNKRGSVVFMDEASFLTDIGQADNAKRIFKRDGITIPTPYLGEEIELPTPPMLVVAANNKPIPDENLRTRFKNINFPMPTASALKDFAKILLAGRIVLLNKIQSRGYDKEKIESEFLEKVKSQFKTFHEIETDIEDFVEYQTRNPRNVEMLESIENLQ